MATLFTILGLVLYLIAAFGDPAGGVVIKLLTIIIASIFFVGGEILRKLK